MSILSERKEKLPAGKLMKEPGNKGKNDGLVKK